LIGKDKYLEYFCPLFYSTFHFILKVCLRKKHKLAKLILKLNFIGT